MSGIHVDFTPPTAAGRLYPRYDVEAGIVAVESRIARPWPYGVDVDGTLICDLDEDRVLANFDLLVPVESWSEAGGLHWPIRAREVDLVFDTDTVERKSFSSPVEAFTDPDRRLLDIRIGTVEPQEAWVLSEGCVALTRGDELVGFIVTPFGGEDRDSNEQERQE